MSELLSLIALGVAIWAHQRAARAERALAAEGRERQAEGAVARGDCAAVSREVRESGGAPAGPTAASGAPLPSPSFEGARVEGGGAPPPVEPAPAPAESAPAPAEPARPWDLERELGAGLSIWLGAAALVLAVAFLVKFSFDRNLLSPSVRVAMGLVAGGVLLGAGELLRERVRGVARGLSAAGIGAIYAALLAGTNLYSLFPPGLGFLGMAATTAAAVALSLRQGEIVALIGLVGGFATPFLIATPDPDPKALFAYLFLLEGGLLLVTARRRWWRVAQLTLLGVLGWGGAWAIVGQLTRDATVGLSLFLVVSAMAFVIAAGRASPEERAENPGVAWLGWGGFGASLVLMTLVVGRAGFTTLEWVFHGLLGAGALAVARLDPRYQPLAGMAAALSAGLLLAWVLAGTAPELARFGATTAALGALYAGGAYALHRGAAQPVWWTGLSAAAALVYVLIAEAGVEPAPFPGFFGVLCVLLAAVYALAARSALGAADAAGRAVVGTLAVGAAALVATGAVLELEREWIALAWALELAALAWIDARINAPLVRGFAALLGAGVAARLLLNPGIVAYPTGTTPIWNWILYGFGVPALALAAAGERLRRSGGARLGGALLGGAMALGAALLFWEVRHAFHAGALEARSFALLEWGTLSTLWLGYGLVLLRLHPRWPGRGLETGGAVVLGLALAQTLLGQGLADNPAWHPHRIDGTVVVNTLLLVYGVPAVGALVAARELRRGQAPAAVVRAAGITGLVLGFTLVTLEVRHAFQGPVLSRGAVGSAELYAYSAAWILLGTVLLGVGIATRGVVIRWASLVVMLLAVGKVFLYDTATLRDLYRVFSLFGLGVSLLLLGFLYQRFVFRDQEE